jgi:hypothetical protein
MKIATTMHLLYNTSLLHRDCICYITSALKEKVYFYTHKFITKEFRGENWASFFKVLNTVKHREESQRW